MTHDLEIPSEWVWTFVPQHDEPSLGDVQAIHQETHEIRIVCTNVLVADGLLIAAEHNELRKIKTTAKKISDGLRGLFGNSSGRKKGGRK